MSKQGSSTTQRDIPAWLEQALKPLLSGSTEALGHFAKQGQNVLQGLNYNQGLPTMGADGTTVAPSGQSFADMIRSYNNQVAQRNRQQYAVEGAGTTGQTGGTT